jgi:hypothetical protein
MQIKPTGDRLYVEVVENTVRDDAPDGLLAEVLSVGPKSKGYKKGDAILVLEWVLTEDQRALPEGQFDGHLAIIGLWDVIAKVTSP